ncbi:hypothetical protein SAMN05421780_10754 [Flexibacter flexilis DSM 6793]|uniref:Uncharacterized protein n=1 Tax=Flexibacter flexilis DSM 6793 TaxID=927664 RepID=A0A1I1KG80_9BACT|nr:hypothetical protein SAMN05421780_10754 [Flexibacter flexilis DSM 6793]
MFKSLQHILLSETTFTSLVPSVDKFLSKKNNTLICSVL